MTEKTWGGARPGAGRKPADPEDKRVQMVITIDRETRDKLKARAKEQHVRVDLDSQVTILQDHQGLSGEQRSEQPGAGTHAADHLLPYNT